jgi:hypothetical protein
VISYNIQEQPAFDKKQFVTFMKRYIKAPDTQIGAREARVV